MELYNELKEAIKECMDASVKARNLKGVFLNLLRTSLISPQMIMISKK